MAEEIRDSKVKELLGKNIVIDGQQYKVVDIFPGFFQDPGLVCQQQAFRPVVVDPFPAWETVTAILWDTDRKIVCSYHKREGDIPFLSFDASDVRTSSVRTDVQTDKKLYSVGYNVTQRKITYVGFMSDREAEAAAISLFSRLQRKTDTVWYQFMFESVIHIYSKDGWTEVPAIKIEAVPSEIIES